MRAQLAAARWSDLNRSAWSPRRWRSSRSRPPMGLWFWGVRVSLWGSDAKRGSTAAVVLASSIAAAGERSGEHSHRTIPDHGAPDGPGKRRYHECRLHVDATVKIGVRCPGP